MAIALGLLNFNLLSTPRLGSLISDEAAASIDRAFRIYILPHGIFSLAVATVLFPTLSRLAVRGVREGMRSATATGARAIALVLHHRLGLGRQTRRGLLEVVPLHARTSSPRDARSTPKARTRID